MKRTSLWWPVLLILAFGVTRWPGFFPDDWKNFSAAVALAFCAGVYLPGALAWWMVTLMAVARGCVLLAWWVYPWVVYSAMSWRVSLPTLAMSFSSAV